MTLDELAERWEKAAIAEAQTGLCSQMTAIRDAGRIAAMLQVAAALRSHEAADRLKLYREALEAIASVTVTNDRANPAHVPAIEGLRNIARAALHPSDTGGE